MMIPDFMNILVQHLAFMSYTQIWMHTQWNIHTNTAQKCVLFACELTNL